MAESVPGSRQPVLLPSPARVSAEAEWSLLLYLVHQTAQVLTSALHQAQHQEWPPLKPGEGGVRRAIDLQDERSRSLRGAQVQEQVLRQAGRVQDGPELLPHLQLREPAFGLPAQL